MGENRFTRSMYVAVKTERSIGDKDVTSKAEQQAHKTGKLHPLVDPSGYGTIRMSLPRMNKNDDGLWEMLVGCPMPIETRIDTTGSMGGNVDIAMEVLPDVFESSSNVLPGYDIQIANGIFGDVTDKFPLCRPQFEMEAHKIIEQLTLMVPERAGGDKPEDPDIGIFGGAYLCRCYINSIGLKGYDFTLTDAPGRGVIEKNKLIRIYGDDVFDKLKENGHSITERTFFDLDAVWDDLLVRAHAFILLVGDDRDAYSFWSRNCTKKRVVKLRHTKHAPYVQSAIIGLVEGSLSIIDVCDFLKQFNISASDASSIADSLIDVQVGLQSRLPNYECRPVKGDLFEGKPNIWDNTNLWPIGHKSEQEENDEQDEWN